MVTLAAIKNRLAPMPQKAVRAAARVRLSSMAPSFIRYDFSIRR
jgi:hypothetical protein